MDLMDAPMEDGQMPAPTDLGLGMETGKMAAFDAQVAARLQAETARVAQNQAAAKAALEKLDAERQAKLHAAMQANREKEQVKMEQVAADAESNNAWARVVSLVDMQADAGASDTARMRQVFIQMKNAKAAA